MLRTLQLWNRGAVTVQIRGQWLWKWELNSSTGSLSRVREGNSGQASRLVVTDIYALIRANQQGYSQQDEL